MASPVREARVARTKAAPISTTERSTVNRQVVPREVPNIAAAGAARTKLAASMGNFFGDLGATVIKAAAEIEVGAIEKENRELAIEATRRASLNPAGAALAIKDGDLSAYAPNEEALNRRAFVETFKITTAKAMAAEDANSFTESLKGLDFDGDPFATRDEALRSQVNGSGDPLFEATYAKSFRESTESPINAWISQRGEYQAAQGQDRRTGLLVSDFENGATFGIEELNNYVGDMVNLASPSKRADAETKAIARFAYEASRRGNQSALNALGAPDPKRNGLSVSDIYPQLVQQSFDQSIAEHKKVRTLAAQTDLDELDMTLKAFENKVPNLAAKDGKVPSLADIGNRVAQHAAKHGNSEQWQAMYARYTKLIAGEGEYSAGFEKAISALTPGAPAAAIPDKWWNENGQRFAADARNALLSRGLSADQADARLGRLAALYNGFGKSFNDGLAHDLTRNPDMDKKLQSYRTLKSIAAENPDAVDDILGEEATSKFFYAMTAEENRGQNPLEALKDFDGIDRQKLGDWKTYLSRTQDTKSRDALVKSVVSKLDDSNRLLDLSMWSNTPVSDEVRQMIATELSRGAWLTAKDGAFDSDRVVETTAKTLASRLELGVDDNGNQIIVPRKTPRRLITEDGRVVAGRPLDEAMQEDAKVAYDASRRFWGNVIGTGIKGVRPDAFGTPRGYGYEVVVEDAAGTTGPVELDAGDYSLNEGALGVEIEGSLKLPIIPPKGGIKLDAQGTLRLMPHPAVPRRYKLYYAGPAPRTESEAQAETMESLLQKGAELDDQKLNSLLGDIGITPTGARSGNLTSSMRARMAEREDEIIARRSDVRARLDAFEASTAGVPRVPSGRGVPVGPVSLRGLENVGSSIKDHFDNLLGGMVESGSLPPEVLINNAGTRELANADEVSVAFSQAMKTARQRGSMFDTNTTPFNATFMSEARTWLGQMEGRRLVAYDDYSGQPITPGAKVKGDPTIAYGFNLNRPDARAVIEGLGLDFNKVRNGEVALTDQQADFLKDVVIKENLEWLRNRFEGADLNRHQWLALLSLTYNSRWDDNGPTLIGPKLTAAIKAGDYEAAAREIEANSNAPGGRPKGIVAALGVRRKREAALFRGDLVSRA